MGTERGRNGNSFDVFTSYKGCYDVPRRTTITLDPDVEALLKEHMRGRGIGFKQAVNEALRAALGAKNRKPFETPTHRMGFDPAVPLDRALRVAGELEDDELVRKLSARK